MSIWNRNFKIQNVDYNIATQNFQKIMKLPNLYELGIKNFLKYLNPNSSQKYHSQNIGRHIASATLNYAIFTIISYSATQKTNRIPSFIEILQFMKLRNFGSPSPSIIIIFNQIK